MGRDFCLATCMFVRICPLNPQDSSFGDKDWGLSFPVLLSQLLPRRINSLVIWRCRGVRPRFYGSRTVSTRAADRLPVSTLTHPRTDIFSPRIRGLTDHRTSHISDSSASRNNLPTSQWERQDLLTHGRFSTRRLASGLHASAAFPADRRVRPAARRHERRTPPPPPLGAVWWGALGRAHPP